MSMEMILLCNFVSKTIDLILTCNKKKIPIHFYIKKLHQIIIQLQTIQHMNVNIFMKVLNQ